MGKFACTFRHVMSPHHIVNYAAISRISDFTLVTSPFGNSSILERTTPVKYGRHFNGFGVYYNKLLFRVMNRPGRIGRRI